MVHVNKCPCEYGRSKPTTEFYKIVDGKKKPQIKFENFVEDIKKYNAGEIKCEFDFVHEGEQYHASVSVKRHEEQENGD